MSSVDRGKAVVEYKDCNAENEQVTALDPGNIEFKVGMGFKSEDEAYETYNVYAISKGFGVRKGQKFWSKSELRGCIFLCSCEGICATRAPYEEIKRERLESRCDCKARIKFKIRDGLWEIVEFNDTHNHAMVDDEHKQFLSSARKLKPATRKLLSSLFNFDTIPRKTYSYLEKRSNALVDFDIGPRKAGRHLEKQTGGTENVSNTEDVQKYQQPRRRSLVSAQEAQSLINYFKTRQLQDVNFFYTFELDEEGRLCNVFWRDGMSLFHYECFGDVIIFDTMYRTNKWNMVFAPFVGVNNHLKNIYFGCAFLNDETILSFEWLFKSFVESMGGKAPKTLFTNQNHAMETAIRNVLPTTRHHFCEPHIEKNAAERIPHLFGQPNFKDKYFNKLLRKCEAESEFQSTWQQMVDEWHVGDNDWLKSLYEVREKWCPAFSRDTFLADINSIQRSESAIRVFNACKTMTLTGFVNQYESRTREMRDTEVSDDYRSRGRPRLLIRDCGILNHAAEVYTWSIFSRFQDEFLQGISERVVCVTTDGTRQLYRTQRGENGESNTVQFDLADHTITCSCQMFKTSGWLRRHALRVMHINLGLDNIPLNYILNRWTKRAKQGISFEDYSVQSNNVFASSLTVRLNSLMMDAFSVMGMATGDDASEEIARKYLNMAKSEIIQHQNTVFSYEDGGSQNGGDNEYEFFNY